ncbi:MAG: sugar ABC transporter permease [Chloroflexi bacterium]|nr:MAG: sugar ABC transporter permease [Chloroflexota bacterium]
MPTRALTTPRSNIPRTSSRRSARTRSSSNKPDDRGAEASAPPLRGPAYPLNVVGRNSTYVAGVMPAAALLALFFVGPALWALYSSLTNLALVGIDAANPRFVGIDNYTRLLADPDFWTVIRNSVVFVVGSAVIGQFGLGLALALLIDHAEHRRWWLGTLAYGAVLLAWVNPTLIAGFLWVAMYDFFFGSLNHVFLSSLGASPVDWLGSFPMPAVIVANIWRGTAFTMIIFLGALKTIPPDIYEAARIDGANAWRRFWDHTLPSLRPIAALALLSITMSTFGTFIVIQTLTNGGPGINTEVIALYAFHTAFKSFSIGYGSAIAVVMLALNFAFAILYLRWSRARA